MIQGKLGWAPKPLLFFLPIDQVCTVQGPVRMHATRAPFAHVGAVLCWGTPVHVTPATGLAPLVKVVLLVP